jgi:ubiquinone biosynthesis UbiH/UbiF/VisC/COQ6 family hydroxylase
MTKDLTLSADIAIVGAGLVGLAAAVSLHQAGYSVTLIDSKPPVAEVISLDIAALNLQVWDTRVYAISPKNVAWLQQMGVWQRMNPERIGKMQAMEISGDASLPPLTLSAEDANSDNLGFIVEANVLTHALMEQVVALGINVLLDSPCTELDVSSNITSSKASVRLKNGRTVESVLLLAADGSHSWVREQLNISVKQKNYDQTAIVANFEVEKSHANIARQWFAHDSESEISILAWLPLPGNRISIVWSVATKYAETLLQLSKEAFTDEVRLAGASALGQLKLMSSRASFPLAMQKSNTIVEDSVVLIGDAAHQVHPMAGQGMNLGFRDVIDLLEVLKDKNQYQSINDSSLLKRYSRLRKADTLNMLLLTDGLYRLFDSQNSIVKKVRNWGLSATKYNVIKKLLVANAVAL